MKLASHVVRLGKIKGGTGLLKATRHNKRAIQAELGAHGHIDPRRTPCNYSLAGKVTPKEIAEQARILMGAAGITKPRKDFVSGVEVIFSLPQGHSIEEKRYFEDCLAWAGDHFGCPVLSFDVHLDESHPHAHCILLPLVNGRMVGSDMVGNKSKLQSILSDFHLHLGPKYGLRKPLTKVNLKDKSELAITVMRHLEKDPVQKSVLWSFVRDEIHRDPVSYATYLNLDFDVKVKRSFAAIMTSKGHGETL